MFIAHFGAGFGAKKFAPTASLGTLFFAAQFLDLLWPSLLLLSIEHVRIVPGATVVTPLVFEHYPVSHSLVAVLAWALLIGGLHFVLKRRAATAAVVGALVASHWFLDALVHQPDLPIFFTASPLIGLNAWSSLPLTLLIEVPIFVLGVVLYARSTQARNAKGRWGLWTLVLTLAGIYAGNLLGSPPPDWRAIAWVGQAQWLLVLWGYWVDKHRVRKTIDTAY